MEKRFERENLRENNLSVQLHENLWLSHYVILVVSRELNMWNG